jgi:hypothetical protein
MAVLHPSPPFDDLTYYPISRWIRGTRGKERPAGPLGPRAEPSTPAA